MNIYLYFQIVIIRAKINNQIIIEHTHTHIYRRPSNMVDGSFGCRRRETMNKPTNLPPICVLFQVCTFCCRFRCCYFCVLNIIVTYRALLDHWPDHCQSGDGVGFILISLSDGFNVQNANARCRTTTTTKPHVRHYSSLIPFLHYERVKS